MNKEEMRNRIEKLLDNYELIKEIAVKMDLKNIKITVDDLYNKYPIGITISELRFNSEYIKSSIEECFIKTKLYDTAYNEEWNLDCFDIPESEKQKLFELKYYKDLFTYKNKEMKIIEYNDFSEEISWFFNQNNVAQDKQDYYLQSFKGSVIIKLGGYYFGDNEYYIIATDKVYLLSCGIWD